MQRTMIETLMGALVLAVAALFFAYSSANLSPTTGYTVTANFNKVTGIGVGSDVRMAGIQIRTVVDPWIRKPISPASR